MAASLEFTFCFLQTWRPGRTLDDREIFDFTDSRLVVPPKENNPASRQSLIFQDCQ